MTNSSEYPKTFTREHDGSSVQVSTRGDEVKAKFDGYKEEVDASASVDSYESSPFSRLGDAS